MKNILKNHNSDFKLLYLYTNISIFIISNKKQFFT